MVGGSHRTRGIVEKASAYEPGRQGVYQAEVCSRSELSNCGETFAAADFAMHHRASAAETRRTDRVEATGVVGEDTKKEERLGGSVQEDANAKGYSQRQEERGVCGVEIRKEEGQLRKWRRLNAHLVVKEGP